jgi:hypothetical protein
VLLSHVILKGRSALTNATSLDDGDIRGNGYRAFCRHHLNHVECRQQSQQNCLETNQNCENFEIAKGSLVHAPWRLVPSAFKTVSAGASLPFATVWPYIDIGPIGASARPSILYESALGLDHSLRQSRL